MPNLFHETPFLILNRYTQSYEFVAYLQFNIFLLCHKNPSGPTPRGAALLGPQPAAADLSFLIPLPPFPDLQLSRLVLFFWAFVYDVSSTKSLSFYYPNFALNFTFYKLYFQGVTPVWYHPIWLPDVSAGSVHRAGRRVLRDFRAPDPSGVLFFITNPQSNQYPFSFKNHSFFNFSVVSIFPVSMMFIAFLFYQMH